MYPKRNIPVVQLSIDRTAPSEVHFEIGWHLNPLREEGILILGSGNIVHNLGSVDWYVKNGGYEWADTFDAYVKESIFSKSYEKIIDYGSAGNSARLAVPILDHFYPLLYVLGALDKEDKVTVYNDARVLGSISMTSYYFE